MSCRLQAHAVGHPGAANKTPSDVPLHQALQLRTSEKENPNMDDEWLYVMQEEEKIIR